MNRKRYSKIAGVCTAIFMIFMFAPSAGAQQIVLKLADYSPLSHAFTVHGAKYFMKRAEELGNGKLKFQHYPSGQLGAAKDLLGVAQKRVADITLVGLAYVSGRVPLNGVVALPYLFDDVLLGNRAYLNAVNGPGILAQEYKKEKVVPLIVHLLPPYEVFSKKPINSLSSLKGLKIRVDGGTKETAVALTGAIPVTLVASEMFLALQRGTMDGSLFAYFNAKPFKVEEVTDYATSGANFGSAAVAWVMSEGKWNELSEEIRNILKKAGVEATNNLAKAVAEEEGQYEKEWETKGKHVYKLNAKDQEEWRNTLIKTEEVWVKDMQKMGLDGARALKEFKSAIEDASRK